LHRMLRRMEEVGSGAGGAKQRKEENGVRRPGSCAGATETGAGRVVSDVVRK
jgi:hypothetical protein